MAYLISLIDGDFAPQRGEVGVMLFLRSSESGYRAQATAILSNGQPSRRLGAWASTCPVAASQEMYQWVSSAGWPQDQIYVANTSQYRPDQIMQGNQPVQKTDWSGDHLSVLQLMITAFGSSQPQPQPPQPQPPQPQPPQPPQPQPPQPQSQPHPARASSIGEREKELGRLLADSVRGLRSGASAQDIIQSLSDSFVDISINDEEDEDEFTEEDDIEEDEHEEDEEDGDESVSEDDIKNYSSLRPLLPGEVPGGLTPDQVAHFYALSDPRAEEKMRRGIERNQQAILRARHVAAAREQAERAQQNSSAVRGSPSVTAPAVVPASVPPPSSDPASTSALALSSGSDVVVLLERDGVSYTSVEHFASASGRTPATVRLWCRQGKVSGAFQGRISGDKVDRWLIPIDAEVS